MAHFQNHASVANQVHTQYIQGGAHFSIAPPPPVPDRRSYDVGVRFGQAPQIDSDYFVGRNREIEQLQTWLAPTTGKQNMVALSGMGGVGKTQLSVHFVRQSAQTYSAVFWLNAKDEATLKAGMAALATEVVETAANSAITDVRDEERLVAQARRWLSLQDNDQWLIVFDNYDEPKLPGMTSVTGYDIRIYLPYRAQGSVLITTRSPRLNFAKQLPLHKLEDETESLSILAARSGRSVDKDQAAAELARRLDGLPLALATAGVYLSQSADSFEDYLQLYEHSWNELRNYDRGPEDYEERTLYTTWNMSLQQVQARDAAAAELLMLTAYLDNRNLRYDLFRVGHDLDDAPAWWVEVSQSQPRFNRAMSILHDYSLLEAHPDGYSLHTCIHDWALEYLNNDTSVDRCRIAVHIVAQSVSLPWNAEYWEINQAVITHARRLLHRRVHAKMAESSIPAENLFYLATLFSAHDMYKEARTLLEQALTGCERDLGLDHPRTLQTVNGLGSVYRSQGKLDAAEQMFKRALAGCERVLGPEHRLTFDTLNHLGSLYHKQGKFDAAERVYERALAGSRKVYKPGHVQVLSTINRLAILYVDQEKLDMAEQMQLQALAGIERECGLDHPWTMTCVDNIGRVYANQGKLDAAEQMHLRALTGLEKALGPDHSLTLRCVQNLYHLYLRQDKLEAAERVLMRALTDLEKTYEPDHKSTPTILRYLGRLYTKQGKFDAAEQMFIRALAGYERTLGPDHTSTLNTINWLGRLYAKNGGLPVGWEHRLIAKRHGYMADPNARATALAKLRL